MNTETLLKQAEVLAVERRPQACLGCGFENSCSLRGCAVIKALITMVDAGQECEAKLAAYVANGLEPEDVEKIYGLLAEVTDDRNCHFDFVTRCVLKVGREIKEKNAPLTLEELRETDGQPVWIEGNAPLVPQWAIVQGGNDFFMQFNAGCNTMLSKEYGKTWLAYRRKPEDSP